MKTQIVIMAAGIGSRFGEGIKQLTPLGPNGEVIMDYSINSAVKAGFDEAVIIIRKDIEKDFKEIIGKRLEKDIKCKYAYQELDKLPAGYEVPTDRVKPYGTAHAIYVAKDMIDSPFVVVNADDYYGDEGFKKVHEHLVLHAAASTGQCPACDHRLRMCMAGYNIGNTLSENGTVTRGICRQNEDGFLTDVVETYEIERKPNGKIVGEDENKNKVDISDDTLVSMNMFGLPYEFVFCLNKKFKEFLEQNNSDIKSEFLLPRVVDDLIKAGDGTVHVLPVKDKWYGVTYASDKEYVRNALKNIKL